MLKDDPKYARFFKMLKLHLPRGAVEQKMKAEGVCATVQTEIIEETRARGGSLIQGASEHACFVSYENALNKPFVVLAPSCSSLPTRILAISPGMDPSVLDLPLDGPSPTLEEEANQVAPERESVSVRLAASEAQTQAEKEKEAAAKAEKAKKANAKARAVYMGPRPTRPIKAVYVDKVGCCGGVGLHT